MSTLLAPGAHLAPVRNTAGDRMPQTLGLVLHVQAGDGLAGIESVFNNPADEASSTWYVMKTGALYQFVADPMTRMWAQGAGNATYQSVETEGFPTEALTSQQITTLESLYKWGHTEFGWAYKTADLVGQTGFGWHGMGGTAWGGHFDCPGDIRKPERTQILAAITPAPNPNPWNPHRLIKINAPQYPYVWEMRLRNGNQLCKAHVPSPTVLQSLIAGGETEQFLIPNTANINKVNAIPEVPFYPSLPLRGSMTLADAAAPLDGEVELGAGSAAWLAEFGASWNVLRQVAH